MRRRGLRAMAALAFCLGLPPMSSEGRSANLLPGSQVRPTGVYATVSRVQPVTVEVRIDLGPEGSGKRPVDVLFVFDQTASMDGVIDEVRQAAVEIFKRSRDLHPNLKVAVASFDDYDVLTEDGAPSPVWHWRHGFSDRLEHLTAALESIRTRGGNTVPEAYSRALYESRWVGWRPRAERILVLFGDAPPHDQNLYGFNTGIDPGRDRIEGTGDDLRFSRVLAGLAADRIRVLAVFDDESEDLAKLAFERMARATSGIAMPIEEADRVPESIVKGIEAMKLGAPIAEIPVKYSGWVTVTPAVPHDGSETRHTMELTLRPPARTKPGTYSFAVSLSVAGRPDIVLGRIPVTLEVEEQSAPDQSTRWLRQPGGI